MMDLGLRDWLLILGPLVIAAVLVHGYWKMRRNGPRLKMSLDKQFQSDIGEVVDTDDLSLLRAELPNGGARLVNSAGEDSTGVDSDQSMDINLDENVPVLMDPIQVDADINDGTGDQLEFGELVAEQEPFSSDSAGPEEKPGTRQSTEKAERPEKLQILNLLSKEAGFNGQQLLESLVTCGFQYGDMNIFHYLDDRTGRPVFSLVNAIEPGTFDLNSMDQLVTPGVSLFIKLHDLDDPVAGFKQLIQKVKQLATELDAAITDEKHNSVTQQALEYELQEVLEYSARYPR